MFKKKNTENKKPQAPLTGADIYTIPQKFYLPELEKGMKGDKTKWVGILIMVLAFLTIVIGGYFFVVKIVF